MPDALLDLELEIAALPPHRHEARKSRVGSIRVAFVAADMSAAREILGIGLRQQARVCVE
jgi:hypothetical protein